MAIDTREKRSSVVSAFQPWVIALPPPDGSVERSHTAYSYSGIAVAAPFEDSELCPPLTVAVLNGAGTTAAVLNGDPTSATILNGDPTTVLILLAGNGSVVVFGGPTTVDIIPCDN